jgi:hypothetical protein
VFPQDFTPKSEPIHSGFSKTLSEAMQTTKELSDREALRESASQRPSLCLNIPDFTALLG